MLGVIHGDTGGRESLISWLELIKPSVVTLEFSKYGLEFRQTNGARLRKRLSDTIGKMGLEMESEDCGPLRSLFSYLNLPYEFVGVSDYAQKTGIPLHLADADFFSRLKLGDVEKMLDRQNLEVLLNCPIPDSHGMVREKVRAELFFKRGIKTYNYTDEMRMRDCFMKDRISLLMRHYGPGCFLHVCGWQHLCDPHDVYSSLRPTKVFVYDRTFRI